MLRSLSFLLHIALISGLLVWSTFQPGTITIQWYSHHITADMGLILAAFYIVLMLILSAHSVWEKAKRIPHNIRQHRIDNRKTNHINDISSGLAALAAGDINRAEKHANAALKTQHNTAHSPGLLLLLQAQIATKQGKDKQASLFLADLAQDKHTGFLGTRTLLQQALSKQDYTTAKRLSSSAVKSAKKSPWLIEASFQTALKQRDWEESLNLLDRLKNNKLVDTATYNAHKTTLYVALADDQDHAKDSYTLLKKALGLSPAFTPAITRLYQYYDDKNKLSALKPVLKKAWKVKPHPSFARYWMDLMPEKYQDKHKFVAAVKWIDQLIKLNPSDYCAHMALGQTCLRAHLWGEARAHFAAARALKTPSHGWFIAMADLEKSEHNDQEEYDDYINKSQHAPADDTWVCSQTGLTYNHWAPLSAPHNSFNTMIWDSPNNHQHEASLYNAPTILLDNL